MFSTALFDATNSLVDMIKLIGKPIDISINNQLLIIQHLYFMLLVVVLGHANVKAPNDVTPSVEATRLTRKKLKQKLATK